MPLRVGIDGAQGTGKTTLLVGLKSHFGSKLRFVPEASRIIAPSFGVNSEPDWQELLADKPRLELFFEAEQEWVLRQQARASCFVIDSSLWLIAAYRQYFGCRSGLIAAREVAYDLLLHCGISELVRSDGFRFSMGQRDVDDTYRSLIADAYGGMSVPLPSGAGRIDAAIEVVTQVLMERGESNG